MAGNRRSARTRIECRIAGRGRGRLVVAERLVDEGVGLRQGRDRRPADRQLEHEIGAVARICAGDVALSEPRVPVPVPVAVEAAVVVVGRESTRRRRAATAHSARGHDPVSPPRRTKSRAPVLVGIPEEEPDPLARDRRRSGTSGRSTRPSAPPTARPSGSSSRRAAGTPGERLRGHDHVLDRAAVGGRPEARLIRPRARRPGPRLSHHGFGGGSGHEPAHELRRAEASNFGFDLLHDARPRRHVGQLGRARRPELELDPHLARRLQALGRRIPLDRRHEHRHHPVPAQAALASELGPGAGVGLGCP